MNLRFFLSLLALSLLLSIPSLLRIPRIVPFVNADVRRAAPNALNELRSRGLWLVNIDLKNVERREKEICFEWEHRYSSRWSSSRAKSRDSRQAARTYRSAPEILTTCVPATDSMTSRGHVEAHRNGFGLFIP